MVADTTKYVLLAANNPLQSVVHAHEKIKVVFQIRENTINGVFPFTSDSPAEHGENYVGGARSSFLRRTAKRSSRINGIGALLCSSLTALVAAWIAFSRSSEALRLTFFLPRGIALQLAFQNSCRELPWSMFE